MAVGNDKRNHETKGNKMTSNEANKIAAAKNAENTNADIEWVARHPRMGSRETESRVECWSIANDSIVETIN